MSYYFWNSGRADNQELPQADRRRIRVHNTERSDRGLEQRE